MTTREKFYGGALELVITADLQLQAGLPRVLVITPSTGDFLVNLGDARNYRLGGPVYYIYNADSTNKLIVTNNGGAALVSAFSIDVGQVGIIMCLANTTLNGAWFMRVRNAGIAPNPAPDEMWYCTAGDWAGSNNALTYEYNPQMDSWALKTDMPAGRQGAATYRDVSAIRLIGGGNSSGTSFATHYKYDPDVWTTETICPDTFESHMAASVTTTGWVFGGRSDGSLGEAVQRRTIEFASGAWTTRTVRPTGRLGYITSAIALSDNAVYLMGGSDLVFTGITNICDKYSADTWVVRQSRPLPACHYNSSARAAQYGYSFCGRGGGTRQDAVSQYDWNTDTWTAKSPFPAGPLQRVQACGSSANIIHVTAGDNVTGRDDNREYDYLSDSYTSKTLVPVTSLNAMNHLQVCNP